MNQTRTAHLGVVVVIMVTAKDIVPVGRHHAAPMDIDRLNLCVVRVRVVELTVVVSPVISTFDAMNATSSSPQQWWLGNSIANAMKEMGPGLHRWSRT